jgi:hypothetical protein
MVRMQKQAILDKFAIPSGCLSCAIGFLISRFSEGGWCAFLAGMCLGVSVVLNLYGFYRYSRAT